LVLPQVTIPRFRVGMFHRALEGGWRRVWEHSGDAGEGCRMCKNWRL
jgi:hypothetical protein